MSEDARTWYVCLDGTHEGPLPTVELLDGFASGRWNARALVWTEALGKWKRAHRVDEIAQVQLRPMGWTPWTLRGVGGFFLVASAGTLVIDEFFVASLGVPMAVLSFWKARQLAREAPREAEATMVPA